MMKMFLFLLFNSGSANEENVYKDPAEVSAEYSWFVFNSETPAASNQFYVFVLFLIAFVIFSVSSASRSECAFSASIAARESS